MFQFNPNFDVICQDDMTLRIIEHFPGDAVMIPFYYYDIYIDGIGRVGSISVRLGNNYHSYYNGHIGYEIDEAFRGHRYALRALRLLLPVARYHGMDSLYLTCAKSNAASKRTIELSGAVFVEEAEVPQDYFAWQEGMDRQLIYRLSL